MSRRLAALILTMAMSMSTPFGSPLAGAALQTEQVYALGDGVTPPAVVREVKPQYTPEAKANKIQGSVWLQIVVQADGTVGDVEVSRSLDQKYGLDEEAVKAARQWTFKPGTKDGKAVPVQVTLELTFTLR